MIPVRFMLACVAGFLGLVVLAGCGGNSQPPTTTSTVTKTVVVPTPSTIEEQWQALAKSVARYEGDDGIAISHRNGRITAISVKGNDESYVIVYTTGTISATAFYRGAKMTMEESTSIAESNSIHYAVDEADQKNRHTAAMALLGSIMTQRYGPRWAIAS